MFTMTLSPTRPGFRGPRYDRGRSAVLASRSTGYLARDRRLTCQHPNVRKSSDLAHEARLTVCLFARRRGSPATPRARMDVNKPAP